MKFHLRLWHHESSREVKGLSRSSAAVQHSHWWSGLSESQTAGDTDLHCPPAPNGTSAQPQHFQSDGHTETLSTFKCTQTHPEVLLETFAPMERNWEVQSHMNWCSDESLGVDESLTGRQPFRYSTETLGLEGNSFHWNSQMDSLCCWCGWTFSRRVDASVSQFEFRMEIINTRTKV